MCTGLSFLLSLKRVIALFEAKGLVAETLRGSDDMGFCIASWIASASKLFDCCPEVVQLR